MHVTFIGMSNIGKSHWAKILGDRFGFEDVDCDRLIGEKLAPLLDNQGPSSTEDMASWMGQPFEARYPLAAQRYLELEARVMLEISQRISSGTSKPLAIATTGSVIHLDASILDALKKTTRLVYLEASPLHATEMLQRYLAAPKPVIWGESFAPRTGEAGLEAVKRCYPAFLEKREQLYRASGGSVIPFERHHGASDQWLRDVLGLAINAGAA